MRECDLKALRYGYRCSPFDRRARGGERSERGSAALSQIPPHDRDGPRIAVRRRAPIVIRFNRPQGGGAYDTSSTGVSTHDPPDACDAIA